MVDLLPDSLVAAWHQVMVEGKATEKRTEDQARDEECFNGGKHGRVLSV